MTATLTPEKTEEFTVPSDLEVPERFKKVYKKAHEILSRPYGWSKGHWQRRDARSSVTSYCLASAIQIAQGREDRIMQTNAARTFIEKNILGGREIPSWNDAKPRRKRDVLHLLEELYDD